MRYPCFYCGKSATSELPDDSVIRAILECPECIESQSRFEEVETLIVGYMEKMRPLLEEWQQLRNRDNIFNRSSRRKQPVPRRSPPSA